MRLGNTEIPVAALAGVITCITAIIGAWIFIDGHFARASDFMEMKKTIQLAEWSFEANQNLMRQDILEDRIWREKNQPTPDRSRIEKWEKQIDRIERRQDRLKELNDQMDLNNTR